MSFVLQVFVARVRQAVLKLYGLEPVQAFDVIRRGFAGISAYRRFGRHVASTERFRAIFMRL